jgi:hypothetical protein
MFRRVIERDQKRQRCVEDSPCGVMSSARRSAASGFEQIVASLAPKKK